MPDGIAKQNGRKLNNSCEIGDASSVFSILQYSTRTASQYAACQSTNAV
jgi:hypothetical protein